MDTFSITNATHSATPKVAFSRYAKEVLGPTYMLSVALVGDQSMRRLNRSYRGCDSATDVLAFPLENDAGEIVIDLRAVERKAQALGIGTTTYLKYVFIHALLHLKGLEHGRTMDRLEDTWCRRFHVRKPW
ncbi:MAG: rRNA maturation RNase YbeY [Candidatus Paceibacteria bacterium]